MVSERRRSAPRGRQARGREPRKGRARPGDLYVDRRRSAVRCSDPSKRALPASLLPRVAARASRHRRREGRRPTPQGDLSSNSQTVPCRPVPPVLRDAIERATRPCRLAVTRRDRGRGDRDRLPTIRLQPIRDGEAARHFATNARAQARAPRHQAAAETAMAAPGATETGNDPGDDRGDARRSRPTHEH